MKALATAAVCLVLASPAHAFFQGGGHGGGFHHHGHGGYPLGVGAPWFAPPEAPVAAPIETPAPPPSFAPFFVIAAPPPLSPPPVAAPLVRRPSGPHIIYIGHVPQIRGPRVIYGTN